MNIFIGITIIYSIFATYFFLFCLKAIYKSINKVHVFFIAMFFIIYYISFYYIQGTVPSELKNWYLIDIILCFISGLGVCTLLYDIYKKSKVILYKLKANKRW